MKPDDVYTRAVARHAELRRELEQLETFLEMYHRLLSESRDGTCQPEAAPQVAIPAAETAATDSLRGRAEVARLAHNQEAAGSNPAPATNHGAHHEPDRAVQGSGAGAAASALPNNPGAQCGEANEPTPPAPEANSPASAMEPQSCGSGEAQAEEPASPPLAADASDVMEVEEVTAPPAAEPIDHNLAASNGVEEIVAPAAPPSPATAVEPSEPSVGGLSERQAQLLGWLKRMADGMGRVEATYQQMARGSGVPFGSVSPCLDALQRRGIIEPRAPGVVRLAEGHRPTKIDVAFDSKVPKPEWVGRERAIVKAPEANGCPEGLAVAGAYLILGKHYIRLPGQGPTIIGRLIKDWGTAVSKDELAAELMSVSIPSMTAKAARSHLDRKPLGELNARLKEAGLIVIQDQGRWRLQLRQEVGATA